MKNQSTNKQKGVAKKTTKNREKSSRGPSKGGIVHPGGSETSRVWTEGGYGRAYLSKKSDKPILHSVDLYTPVGQRPGEHPLQTA